MNTRSESSAWHRAADMLGAAVSVLVCGLLRTLGAALSAILWIIEPLVRTALSYLALGTLLTAGLFYVAGSPGRHVSYGILLGFAGACVLLLVLYSALLRLLER